MKRALALSMAAVTALTSTSICAFAEGQDSKALAAAITVAKTRLDIPEELTEFSYTTTNKNLKETYSLTWSTPVDAEEYKTVTVNVSGSLITSFNNSNDGWSWDDQSLAKLSGDELYEKAKATIKKINPTVAKVINIDRDSLNINLYSQRATFSFVRMKNGVPVSNDRGSIVLDKDTGELISFNMNWHEKATFQSAKKAISEDKAKDKYLEMIDLQPQYEIYIDWNENGSEKKSRLVYTQNDYGEINAFTGKKSNFSADGYFGDDMNDTVTEDSAEMDKGEAGNGGYQFTEQEQAELDKKLPYAGEAAIKKMLESDPYLTYKDDMELSYSDLNKVVIGDNTHYYYTATFTNENWGDEVEEPMPLYDVVEDEVEVAEDVVYEVPAIEDAYQWLNITVDAESGQLISYNYYDSTVGTKTSYDMTKADKLAGEIAEKYAGEKLSEYKTDGSDLLSWMDGKTEYINGSNHRWTRYANDIKVSGDQIYIDFNSDMTLCCYNIDYTEVEFADPAGMLTEKRVMDKFWQTHDLDLYYLARLDNKVTKTVLVYGTDTNVYVDAFTGEPVYGYYTKQENDLSGIKNKTIKKMAQTLSDHGMIISTEKFSENDAATVEQFQNVFGVYVSETESTEKLTRGTAMKLYVRSECGDVIPSLKGIYKSPFSDVSDSDENVGYYAIAYGMGIVSGDKLNADKVFTMGDMIKMIYTMYSGE